MIDPPREVTQAVKEASAGIKTIMITGDHKTTEGKQSPAEIGILKKAIRR